MRIPTKIPTARAIMIGTMNCPSLMYFVDKSFYLVKNEGCFLMSITLRIKK